MSRHNRERRRVRAGLKAAGFAPAMREKKFGGPTYFLHHLGVSGSFMSETPSHRDETVQYAQNDGPPKAASTLVFEHECSRTVR